MTQAPHTRRRLLQAGASGALLLSARAQAARDPPLRVALVPYLSPRALLETWEPLRLYLVAALSQPVEMYSAANFRALVESVRRRAQDLTLMPVHLGQMLAQEGTTQWVAMSSRRSDVLLATTLPPEARWEGRRIGVGDPLSVLTLIGRRWIAASGLSDRVTVVEGPNPSTLAVWLARGEVDAIVVSSAQIPDLPPLRGLTALRTMLLDWILTPGWQVPADMPAPRRRELQAALLAYRPEDRGTAATTTWVVPDAAQLARYDPLAATARAILEGRR
ncbi:MAG: PhnD/SsuA/transferrin family substrate-binding protein [Sutterellaceae bacterium]|nr:phosphate/phosphite/phosphonate ABC transporter substrate-binding protein [Burkholderiaceae bacterium]MDW8429789.1 PhnD/SsuA/transferrin family substrate-binding protein [Sutterellaceae bacterium]